ncbi:MAG: response regulator transcription factor [Actinomyces graevenitzii]|jgi:response regulator|uniref:response regulator n=1 Tax=Actinomyces graevenitzii TaxID=55565 RepID=UPI000C8105BB|nr:response regulator transcription factor [Actinomyces graevenitzii]MBF0971365.1 response regulator transcription factor [Actinomyces graevenitzii]MBS5244859.1 response regulator transcription factor [Actinomyces graevenitzii]MBS6934642.1 response regulator transcription factor [Actinomyces graevenitzii]PMC91212.1 DNA-binding response regulator [Actinomyces graevenitzii]
MAAAGMIRVLLADDQALIRMGFRMVLDAEADIEVVGEAADGAAAITQAKALNPDVVLMDIRMPGVNGIEATAEITRTLDTKVLILTTFDLDEYAFGGLRAGASGFLLKDTRPAELIEAIRTVASGEAVVSPRITRRMLEMFAGQLPSGATASGQVDPRIASLTPRETEILRLVARGMSNAEIAAELVVSATTVKTHVGSVLAKLGVRDRVQAVVVAYETGLVS